MYYDKLGLFIKSKGLKQKEFAEILGYSPNMVSKYLNGSSDISGEFVMKLSKAFPEVDLNEIFSNQTDNVDLVEEPIESYNFNVIKEIEEIEKKLSRVKSELAKKNL